VIFRKPNPPLSGEDARRQFAEALRQLASGLITNDRFDSAYAGIRTDDGAAMHAIEQIHEFAWSFYHDLYPHQLRGKHRLSPLQRRVFARCVLFLHTDLAYEWPSNAKWLWNERGDRGLGYWTQVVFTSFSKSARAEARRREHEADERIRHDAVDDRIWPFRRRSDLEQVNADPRLLGATAH